MQVHGEQLKELQQQQEADLKAVIKQLLSQHTRLDLGKEKIERLQQEFSDAAASALAQQVRHPSQAAYAEVCLLGNAAQLWCLIAAVLDVFAMRHHTWQLQT